MPYLLWSKDLSVGVHTLDEEHKILIDQLNAFYDAMQMNIAPKLLIGTMEALMYYATTHFTHEEEYMLATGYPDFLEHKIEHDILRSKIMEMHACALQNASQELTNELLAFMKCWVSGHVHYCDKALGDYLALRKIA